MFTPKEIKILDKAKNDFVFFTNNIGKYSIDGFVGGQHIDNTARFLSQNKKSMTMSFRSSSKSIMVYLYIMWKLLFEGAWKSLELFYFSYNEKLSGIHTRYIRESIKRNPFFRHVRDLKPSAESVGAWTWDGKHITRLVPMGIKGFGRGVHGDIVLADDLLSDPANPLNPLEVKKVNEIFASVLLQCIKPDGEIHVVGCVNPNTWILTNDGFQQLKELPIPEKAGTYKKENKRIFGIGGFHSSSHIFNKGLSKTKIISTPEGYSVECSLEHPILTIDKEGIQKWKRAENFNIGDWVAIQSNQQAFGHNAELSEDEAYLMGLWIAEGSMDTNGGSHRFTVSNSEPEIQSFLQKRGWKKHQEQKFRKNDVELFKRWKSFGMIFEKAPKKRVPSIIFKSEKRIIKEFLRGYADGDGSNPKKAGAIVLSSTSEKLLKEIQILLLNFGVISHFYQVGEIGRIGGIGQDGKRIISKHNSYWIKINSIFHKKYLQEIGFRLSRKQNSIQKTRRPLGCLVPFQGKLLNKTLIKKRGGIICDNINHREQIFSETLKKLISDTSNVKLNDSYSNIQQNLKYYWTKIEKITSSENQVADFVIPKSHSFFSNGFISHNTPMTREDFFYLPEIRKGFAYREIPAIVDEGLEGKERSAWPEFITLEALKQKRETIGPKRFNREFMTSPFYSEEAFFSKPYLRKQAVNPDLTNRNIAVPYKTENLTVAGFDVGRKNHPSCLLVFERKDDKWIMPHWRMMISPSTQNVWPYTAGKEEYDPWKPTQIEYLKLAIKNLCIDSLYYDATRGELEGFRDQGLLPPQMIPIVFTYKFKNESASILDKMVLNKEIEMVNDEMLLDSVSSVTNDLMAVSKAHSHGDAFMSLLLCTTGFKKIRISGSEIAKPSFGGRGLFEKDGEVPLGW